MQVNKHIKKNKFNEYFSVLVVEDDKDFCFLLNKALVNEGLKPNFVSKGAEAITHVLENPNTLILLDNFLPDMKGKEIIKTLQDKLGKVYFIVMTGFGDQKLAVEMMKLGARDYLIKDNKFHRLFPTVVKKAISQISTEKKLEKTTAALMESEEKYRCLFEYASDSTFIIDPTTLKIYDANLNASKLLGYTKAELHKMRICDLYPPEVAAHEKSIFRELKKRGDVIYESQFLRKDGSDIPVEISSRMIRYSGKHVFQSFVRDITERVRANKSLKHKNKIIQLLQGIAVIANEAPTVEEAMRICLEQVCSHTGWPIGHVYLPKSSGKILPAGIWYIGDPQRFKLFREVTEKTFLNSGVGLPGRVLANGSPAWIKDVTNDPNFPRAKFAKDVGIKAGFAFPVLEGKKIVAILEFFSSKAKEPDELLLEAISNLGTQLGRVTERKRAEDILRNSEGKYRSLVENIGIGISLISPQMKILTLNKQMKKWFPSIEDVSRKPTCYKLFNNPPRKGICSHCPVVRTFKDGKPHEDITDTPSKDGNKNYRIISSPIKNKDGKTTAVIEMVEDITVRKKTEDALKESDLRFRALAESCQDGIFAYNSDIRYTLWNSAMERISGYKADEIMGKKPFEVFPFLNEVGEGNAFSDTVKGKTTVRAAMPFPLSETGKKGYFESSHFPLFDSRGNVAGGMGIIRDVSERIWSEEKAKIQQQKLIQADKMTSLGILVAGIGHEINNPDSFIMMNAPLLGEIWEDAKPLIYAGAKISGETDLAGMPFDKAIEVFPKLVAGILNGSKRIKKIVMDLRDFARTDATGYNNIVDIEEAIESSKNLMASMIKKSTKNCRTNIEEVPKIRGNLQKLEQVFINLISNSCHALTDTNQALEINASHDKFRDLVVIEVKDEGMGMDDITLQRIMEPFFSTRHKSGGTGLGVSISYGIIKEHGGTMEYRSEPSKGTTVTIKLPVKK